MWLFYYDGNCGFCTKAVKCLKALDLFNRVRWVPFQSLEEPPEGLSWDDLNASAYLDTGGGRLQEGFYAFRRLTLRIPLLTPLAPLLWCPGVQFPGTVAYRWIARNRYRFSRCGLPRFNGRQTHRTPRQ